MRWNEYEVEAGRLPYSPIIPGSGYRMYYIHKFKGWALVKAFFRALPNLRFRNPVRWPFYFLES